MKNPKVTVIVPVYNVENYLYDCITSILGQTYQNLEIILINDGSTDNSPEIINSFAKTDKRIKIIHQKNSGLSNARNTGLNNATGKYITFVDSDDYIDQRMIEHMTNAINDTQASIVCCSFKEVYPSGKTIGFSHGYQAKTFNTPNALRAMLQEQGFMISTTMKLFPKEYFKNIEFPEGKLHEDVGTTYKLFLQASKIAYIPNEDYYYVHHEDSIIGKFNNHKFDLIELTDRMCNDIDNNYPQLKNITNERRIRARLSILRQIPLSHPKTQELINYLKAHQEYITKNPEANTISKYALKLALFNPKLFQIAYRLFK